MNTTFVIIYKDTIVKSPYYRTCNIEALSSISALRVFEEEHPSATFKVMYDKSIDLIELINEE